MNTICLFFHSTRDLQPQKTPMGSLPSFTVLGTVMQMFCYLGYQPFHVVLQVCSITIEVSQERNHQ